MTTQLTGFSPTSCCLPYVCTALALQILAYWTISGLNKWVDVGIQCGMVAIYRILFWLALSVKEWWRQR